MSTPDLLERVRMCLAEVGEPTDGVRWTEAGVVDVGISDYRTAWMAWSLAVAPDIALAPACLACSSRRSILLGRGERDLAKATAEACEATRPCMEDCGRDRGGS